MNFLQKRQQLIETMKIIPESVKREYLNYTVEDGKIYGVPVKGQETYKNCLLSIDDPENHKLYLETKLEMLKLQNSLFGLGDPKLNKQIKNYELYLKRFNKALACL